MTGTLNPEPAPPSTVEQLRILIDRSAKGLSVAERARPTGRGRTATDTPGQSCRFPHSQRAVDGLTRLAGPAPPPSL